MSTRSPADHLVRAAQAALTLGVEVATLQRWNIFQSGPVAVTGLDCAELAYRQADLDAWQNHEAWQNCMA